MLLVHCCFFLCCLCQTSIAFPVNKSYEALGCYKLPRSYQETDRSLENSHEFCYQTCIDHEYFGVKYKKCYCFNDSSLESSLGETCTEICPGNKALKCGEQGNPGLVSFFRNTGYSRPVAQNETTRQLNTSLAEEIVTSSSEMLITDNYTLPTAKTTLVDRNDSSTSNSSSTTVSNITTEETFSNFTPIADNATLISVTMVGDDNLTDTKFYNSTVRPILVGTTLFPNLITDTDEGLVAGMSVLVVAIFGFCIFFVFARKCYRHSRRSKDEGMIYEEVEDAATSCSIEGSSNVKFLIGRARHINKSRIDQVNEEWNTGKPTIRQNMLQSYPEPEVYQKDTSSSNSQTNAFSKCSIKSQRKKIVEDEDSEYATAEPEEDLYSLAGAEDENHTYDISSISEEDNCNMSEPFLKSRVKLKRGMAFEDEDPYSETPEDDYDELNTHRSHKKPIDKTSVCSSDEAPVENLYELSEEGEYDCIGKARPHIGTGIHRSKSREKLTEDLNDGTVAEIFNESFEGEYDMLNKPRFRITITSTNYDNVTLPFEIADQQYNGEPQEEVCEFNGLERHEKVESNIYADMDSLLKNRPMRTESDSGDMTKCIQKDNFVNLSYDRKDLTETKSTIKSAIDVEKSTDLTKADRNVMKDDEIVVCNDSLEDSSNNGKRMDANGKIAECSCDDLSKYNTDVGQNVENMSDVLSDRLPMNDIPKSMDKRGTECQDKHDDLTNFLNEDDSILDRINGNPSQTSVSKSSNDNENMIEMDSLTETYPESNDYIDKRQHSSILESANSSDLQVIIQENKCEDHNKVLNIQNKCFGLNLGTSNIPESSTINNGNIPDNDFSKVNGIVDEEMFCA